MPGFREVLGLVEGLRAWLLDLDRKGYDVSGGAAEVFTPKQGVAGAARRGPTWAPARYRPEDSYTAFTTDRALDYIHTREEDPPWFVHLSLYSPHPPFVAADPYHDLYHPDDVPAYRRARSPQSEAAQHPYAAYIGRHFHQRDDHDAAHHPATEPAMGQLRATYYGMISEVDHHLGRLFDGLRREGRYDDTIIVFGSDHGEQLWDHWLLGKETYYDQSYHVPLIVRAPGPLMNRARGRVVDAMTENVSIMPTILELIGADIPVQCDQASLAPFLRGTTPRGWPGQVCWELDFRDILKAVPEVELGLGLDQCNLAVLRDRRYKYVHFTALPPMLFDVENDPDELHNLAADPAHQPTVLEYAQRMLSWRLGHGDRTLTGIRLSAGGAYEVAPARRRWPRAGATPASPGRVPRAGRKASGKSKNKTRSRKR
jgi:arylsulfatase A-like enzyme